MSYDDDDDDLLLDVHATYFEDTRKDDHKRTWSILYKENL